MSGQGADEIISDYYNEFTNSRRSCFKGNWKLAKEFGIIFIMDGTKFILLLQSVLLAVTV